MQMKLSFEKKRKIIKSPIDKLITGCHGNAW